ncbi:pyridoxamine 5'-phosphate oxidase family protein [Leeia sp. TBRC 13508]|uniref:Pyridoxamine 5'-phosphate oxidase family protein n=1 Tax=Leeia speluncae TaxID=2884804 RepID=A0ABS8D6V0_9NEIS|nr:pyridoxamine 5'-phosphate oxidase family protein [Leeia speluncae]MCB6183919.1 pyridoxamine 5'-phosphate oxidase family protein [Leeia speluncae]
MGSILDLAVFKKECDAFPSQFASLQLATVSASGEPEASYAPFVEKDGRYYIFVSELAAHTHNLRHHPQCSALFIEDETSASHVFGRKRLTLSCEVTHCPRDEAKFDVVLNAFEEKFGRFIEVLRKLADFHLYELQPVRGAFVAGFAKAFVLEGNGLSEFRHRNEVGHQTTGKAHQSEMDALAAPNRTAH